MTLFVQNGGQNLEAGGDVRFRRHGDSDVSLIAGLGPGVQLDPIFKHFRRQFPGVPVGVG